jgi:Ca2+-binding EF-hand superfamily protein
MSPDELLQNTRKLSRQQVGQDGQISGIFTVHLTSEVSAVFDHHDKDGDGKLPRQEFKAMMMKRRGSQ